MDATVDAMAVFIGKDIDGNAAYAKFNAEGSLLVSSVNPPATPKIYNMSAPTARTEVSHVLSANTKQLIVRVRGVANLQLAFISGESSTNYITIPSGASLSLTDLKTSVTLYLQTDKNSQVIEILEWT